MTEQEKIAKLWKVGRLLVGKTQKELAQALAISQSSISKYESRSLEPSATHWYLFCQFTGIDAHKTLQLGYIDGKKEFKHRLFDETLLKIPLEYKKDFLLKVRELIPFRQAIIHELGQAVWAEFLTETEIEDDLFFVYDFQVSMKLLNDLIKWSEYKGIDILQMVEPLLGQSKFYGIVTENYARKKKFSDLFQDLLEDQVYFQRVFTSEYHLDQNKIISKNIFTKDAKDYFKKEELQQYASIKIKSFELILSNERPETLNFDYKILPDHFMFTVSA